MDTLKYFLIPRFVTDKFTFVQSNFTKIKSKDTVDKIDVSFEEFKKKTKQKKNNTQLTFYLNNKRRESCVNTRGIPPTAQLFWNGVPHILGQTWMRGTPSHVLMEGIHPFSGLDGGTPSARQRLPPPAKWGTPIQTSEGVPPVQIWEGVVYNTTINEVFGSLQVVARQYGIPAETLRRKIKQSQLNNVAGNFHLFHSPMNIGDGFCHPSLLFCIVSNIC